MSSLNSSGVKEVEIPSITAVKESKFKVIWLSSYCVVLGKVTISTVLGSKEYVVENIKNIRGEDEENSDFRIYPDYHKIYRGQTEIVLTKAEYELFMLLSGRPGVIFTKEKIFEILYNEELPESIDNIVYCLVSSMRKKIEPELKQCRYIKTVRGVGYKFEGKKMDIFPE